jgi:hypothetical protein
MSLKHLLHRIPVIKHIVFLINRRKLYKKMKKEKPFIYK